MIAVVLAVVWMVAGARIAVAIGRAMREADRCQPEPDWLWSRPTDSLSDAAVDARFAEIAAHFTVRQ